MSPRIKAGGITSRQAMIPALNTQMLRRGIEQRSDEKDRDEFHPSTLQPRETDRHRARSGKSFGDSASYGSALTTLATSPGMTMPTRMRTRGSRRVCSFDRRSGSIEYYPLPRSRATSGDQVNAGCRVMSSRARCRRSRPGGIRCQGEAPEGWGNGIRSNCRSARWTRKLRPTIVSSLAEGINCAIASLPTGMTSRGCRISISRFNHDEQFSISCGLGTRSLPPGALPGKQRQTAAK